MWFYNRGKPCNIQWDLSKLMFNFNKIKCWQITNWNTMGGVEKHE